MLDRRARAVGVSDAKMLYNIHCTRAWTTASLRAGSVVLNWEARHMAKQVATTFRLLKTGRPWTCDPHNAGISPCSVVDPKKVADLWFLQRWHQTAAVTNSGEQNNGEVESSCEPAIRKNLGIPAAHPPSASTDVCLASGILWDILPKHIELS
jgi:hypothetical protein